MNHNYKSTFIQAVLGIITIPFFNVFRIGMLVVLRDLGGDAYFFFIKYIFGVFIYVSIIALLLLKPAIDKRLDKLF